jgi:beta-lactamase superfamily II metal-dependent hydrolase
MSSAGKALNIPCFFAPEFRFAIGQLQCYKRFHFSSATEIQRRTTMIRRALGVLSALSYIACLEARYAAQVELHFIYVGQGDCTLIKTDDDRKILVDCGSTGGGDVDEVREYVLAQLGGNPELDVLVITHPDADHYNLVEAVLEGVEVHKVLHVGATDEYPKANFTTWLDDHPNRTSLMSNDFDPPNAPSDRFGEGDVKFHVLSAGRLRLRIRDGSRLE